MRVGHRYLCLGELGTQMLGEKDRRQPELFVAGSLRELLPDDHILVRVDRVLDLSWLRGEVADPRPTISRRPSVVTATAIIAATETMRPPSHGKRSRLPTLRRVAAMG